MSARNKAGVNWEAHCLVVPLLSELWKSPGFLEKSGEVWGRPGEGNNDLLAYLAGSHSNY